MPRRERLKYAALACVLLAEPGFLIWHATTPGNTVIRVHPIVALSLGVAVLAGLVWWVLRGRA